MLGHELFSCERSLNQPKLSHTCFYLFDKPIKSLYLHSFVVSVLFVHFHFKVIEKSHYCPLFSGSVLPLGKMELNPVAGLVLLSRATAVCDDKPSLADLDSEEDDDDEHGKFLSTTEINCLIPIIFILSYYKKR